MKVTLVKKSKSLKAAAPHVSGPVLGFNLQDNGDDSCTVFGVDAGGNQTDISGVATIVVTSSNPAVLTVDTPVGMTFNMHAVGPVGASDVDATATWNDGSIGPFSFTLPVTVIAGPVTGVVIVPGTPTSH